MKLSQAEIEALKKIKTGSILTSDIPDKNEKDVVFGTVEPGMKVYQALEKKGLAIITEEEPIPELDDFVFTNEVYITDEGLLELKVNE